LPKAEAGVNSLLTEALPPCLLVRYCLCGACNKAKTDCAVTCAGWGGVDSRLGQENYLQTGSRTVVCQVWSANTFVDPQKKKKKKKNMKKKKKKEKKKSRTNEIPGKRPGKG
jgi:hypothetical protein